MTKKPSPPPDTPPQVEAEAKPELRPANENPWYLLATLHGEQKGEYFGEIDQELHAKNRMAWNRYMATIAATDVLEKAKALKNGDGSPRIPPRELQRYDEEELAGLKKKFRRRGGGELPERDIDFSYTSFTSAAFFDGFWFSQDVNFDSTIFSSDAGFSSVTFSGIAWFLRANFSSDAWLDRANFSSDAWFGQTIFKGSLSFANAHFKTHPPNFNGAPTLFEGTIWPDPEGWPPAPSDVGEARKHQHCYEKLKKDAETHKKHRLEQFFFSKELECQQVIDGPWRGWLTKLYGLFSDYGASIAKPVRWLGVLVFVAFLFLLGTEECPLKEGKYCAPGTETHLLPMGKALGLAAASVVGLLPIKKDVFGETGQAFSAAAHVIMGVEALFGALLLFLLGLALRNRFRMK